MRHLFAKAPWIGASLRDCRVEDSGDRKQYASTDHPSKLHEPAEQELELLIELVAISAEYSETCDIRRALTKSHPADRPLTMDGGIQAGLRQ